MAKKTEKTAEAVIVKSKLTPVNSEKAFFLSHGGVYMFKVPAKMSKQSIAKAVAEEFKVKPVNVTVSVRKGKMARGSKGAKRFPIQIQRPDVRFAYVRLAAGETLPFFDEQKAEAKDAAKANKDLEKAEKKGKK
ncbi:50S ribosomal protein L23 [Candidatus Saccharibacteria bacterium]|nr:50S ribosomal protein L23 [Candidatus Saccharibacteria bacterium]